MTFNELLTTIASQTGLQPQRSGQGYVARCPAHGDKAPSLSISQTSDGKILVNCFAGCAYDDICSALNIHPADLFPRENKENYKFSAKRTLYHYTNEQNKTLFTKVRLEPGFDGKEKSFHYERYDEHGTLIKNLTGCRRVLYRLPELLHGIKDGKIIFLVEGEKDVERLMREGLIATTTIESLQWHNDFTKVLQDSDVVILYDMDKTGFKRRNGLCKALFGQAKRLRVVDLPGLEYSEKHGKDVSDWLDMGYTIAQFQELVDKTPDYVPKQSADPEGPSLVLGPKKSKLVAIPLGDFLQKELPKQELILTPFLPTRGIALLYAMRGIGKTHVALGIAFAVATGGSFLSWSAPTPRKVLYIDGEMPAAAMQERLQRLSRGKEFDMSFFCLITGLTQLSKVLSWS